LAQINDNENNIAASQLAWKSATDVTRDISVYLFGMRGLGANRIRQGDIAGANTTFGEAISAALSDQFKGSPNTYPREYRYVEAAATEAFWLTSARTPDCTSITSHFDSSLRYIAEAHTTINPSDPGYLSMLLATRAGLNYLRRARLNCGSINEEVLVADDCLAIGEVLDNASFAFFGYRGAPEKAGEADSDFFSLYYLPDVENCMVTASMTFRCTWPERDEADTDARATALVGKLSACKNLSGMTKAISTRESSSRTMQTASLRVENRGSIQVTRSHWKNKDGSPAEWGVTLYVTKQ
jgi:hypothetical protein